MNYDNLKKFFTELTDIVYKERITVLAFMIGFGLIQAFSYFYDQSNSAFKKLDVILLSSLDDSIHSSSHSSSTIRTENEATTQRLFSFNPSTVSHSELLELGFSPKVANILIHYREKGGRFFKKEDVKKIFGVSPELYARIEPYILISNQDFASNFKNKSDEKKPQIIDINHASFEEWKALPGIGDFYANKFVKMREGLGAFLSVEQIGETYGLADSTFQKIKPYLKITRGAIKKVNINSATKEILLSNPYIMKWQADDILKNRPIYGLDDLYELYTFKDRAKHKKLEPYLEF